MSRHATNLHWSHFLCWIWECNQFLKICYRLQMRPSRSFIGLLRRQTPFENKSADSKCTFHGLLWGMPGMPGHAQRCPNVTNYTSLWSYKRPEFILSKKIAKFIWYGKNRQTGYFGIICIYKSRQFVYFSSRHLQIHYKVPYMLNLGARAASGTPGMPWKKCENCNCQRASTGDRGAKHQWNEKLASFGGRSSFLKILCGNGFCIRNRRKNVY